MVVEKRIWVVLPNRGREPRTYAWTVLDIGFGGNRAEEKDLYRSQIRAGRQGSTPRGNSDLNATSPC